jgi:hypothetical protein
MRQLRFAIALFVLLPGAAAAQQTRSDSSQAAPPEASETRFRDFINASVVSPLFYLQVAGAGLIDEVGGFPKEWHGSDGFKDRTLVRLAQGFVAEGLGHGVAAVLNHRVQYDACTCRGGLSRTKHALGRAFVSVTDYGGRGPNVSLWIAKYGSAAIADPWYPASYKQKDVLIQGSVALAIAAGLNVVKEFAPELLRLVPF